MIYNRFNARVLNDVKLGRKFYANSTLYDPYSIDKIEIWRSRYDIETPELLEDTIYGSRIIFHEVSNHAYNVLGFTASTQVTNYIKLMEYEQAFVNETDFLVVHNFDDRFVTVTIYDQFGSEFMADEIISVDDNTIRIKFAAPMSGNVDVIGKILVDTEVEYMVRQYNQNVSTPSTSVIITHNLNDDQPSVTCYNTSYQYIMPSSVDIINSNQLRVNFASNFTGMIVLVGGNAGFAKAGFSEKACAFGTSVGCITSHCGTDKFIIFTGQNDKLLLDVNGDEQTITLPEGMLSITDIINHINGTWLYGTAENFEGKLKLCSNTYGITAELELKAIGAQAYDTLGLTQGLYKGLGSVPATITGSKIEPFTFTVAENTLEIEINRYDPVTVTFADGTYTASQVANMITAVFTANHIPAEATALGGRVIISVTDADGISRDSIGNYYATFPVPVDFLDEGVLNACFLDVWHYRPSSNYPSSIPDDTCCFVVYPDNSFLDCGYNDYEYDISLVNAYFVKGEKKNLRATIQVLPLNQTPEINDWVLPIAESKYRIETRGGDLVQDWTLVDIVAGKEIKVLLDTTSLQAGQYKVRFKLQMPNNQVVMTDWQKFHIIGESN